MYVLSVVHQMHADGTYPGCASHHTMQISERIGKPCCCQNLDAAHAMQAAAPELSQPDAAPATDSSALAGPSDQCCPQHAQLAADRQMSEAAKPVTASEPAPDRYDCQGLKLLTGDRQLAWERFAKRHIEARHGSNGQAESKPVCYSPTLLPCHV